MSSCRILVADDNDDITSVVAMLLQLEGHTVRTASSGVDAIAAARQFEPEVALIDIGMPGMNGYDVARQIRAIGAQKKPVLIAVSGWGTETDKQMALDAGFDQHLTKPVDFDNLLAVINVVAA